MGIYTLLPGVMISNQDEIFTIQWTIQLCGRKKRMGQSQCEIWLTFMRSTYNVMRWVSMTICLGNLQLENMLSCTNPCHIVYDQCIFQPHFEIRMLYILVFYKYKNNYKYPNIKTMRDFKAEQFIQLVGRKT